MATTITFPIDAVYTWVDGSDPAWLARRQTMLERMASSGVPVRETNINECRFQDNGELRYSLRSLARFAPWVRRVYLLTDNQKPQWLDEGSVRLVRHEDVFPPDSLLPVFNSRAIESVQHRIPGLAEHFISLNDDFLLGRPVEEIDFSFRTGHLVFGLHVVPHAIAGGGQKKSLPPCRHMRRDASAHGSLFRNDLTQRVLTACAIFPDL